MKHTTAWLHLFVMTKMFARASCGLHLNSLVEVSSEYAFQNVFFPHIRRILNAMSLNFFTVMVEGAYLNREYHVYYRIQLKVHVIV